MLHRAGLVEYRRADRWQRETASALADGTGVEALALLHHPPVYTLGRRGDRGNLLIDNAAIEAGGASVIQADRGGDVTFHGPGQLVAYPVLQLRRRALRAGDYVRALEQIVIETLACFDVRGERMRGRPGVWVAGEKIAAVGVRIARGVSRHGFALNVSTELRRFDAIVPCGIPGVAVTSLERLLGVAPPLDDVEEALLVAFAAAFDSRLVEAKDSALGPLRQATVRAG